MVNAKSNSPQIANSHSLAPSQPAVGAVQSENAISATVWQDLYGRLREIASAHMRRESNQSLLQTTVVVHEAYMRMSKSENQWSDRNLFLASASVAMRRVLVDSARARKAEKRGGGKQRVELSEACLAVDHSWVAFRDLDEALTKLKEFAPQDASVLEMMIFGGMTGEEVAKCMDVSASTVDRRVRAAKAWLKRELSE